MTEATTPGAPPPRLTSSENGPLLDLGDHRGRAVLGARDTGDAFALFTLEADAGCAVPPHVHLREDETFYVLSGGFRFDVGGATWEAGPGDCVFAPRGVPHAWRSDGGGRALAVVSPGLNFESFARAMAEAGVDARDPATLVRFAEVAGRHGVVPLPPPGRPA